MTRKTMRGHVYSGMKDPAMASLPPGAIDKVLNEGVRDVVVKTGVVKGRWERSTVKGTELYGLPDYGKPGGAVRIIQLTYDIYPLRPTQDAHANVRANLAQGPPDRYYPIPGGFGLIPIPNEAKTLTIEASRFPDDMTLDDSECPLPIEMHQLPVMFAIYRASFIYEPQNTELYYQRYLAETKRMVGDILPEQLDESWGIGDAGLTIPTSRLYGSSATVGAPE